MPTRVLVALIAILLLDIQSVSAQLSYPVTNGADSGPGSLRQAILDVNRVGPCPPFVTLSISFPNREGRDTPPLRIDLQSPLPPLTNPSCKIDISGGPAANWPAAEISGAGDGLRIHYTGDVRILGIAFTGLTGHGVVVNGSLRVEFIRVTVSDNGKNGILVVDSQQVSIGSSVVSGNGSNGIYATRSSELDIRHSTFTQNSANGIHVDGVRGARLTDVAIRKNALTGLLITGDSAPIVTFGTFADNGLLGIDIGGDGPTLANAPVIESAESSRGTTRVVTTFRGEPNTSVRIMLYTMDEPDPSGFGEGPRGARETEVMTDADGIARLVTLLGGIDSGYVSAIATTVAGTSEFSRSVPITEGAFDFVVTTSRDSGPGSLRDMIEQVNASDRCVGPCYIVFRIADPPSADNGVHTIALRTALPVITHNAVVIDAATQREFGGDTNPFGPEVEIHGSACDGCNGIEARPREDTPYDPLLLMTDVAINGFAGSGVIVREPAGSPRRPRGVITRCYIGTDARGTRPIPNGRGIVGENVGIAVAQSIVSGNRGDGIAVEGGQVSTSSSRIGTDLTSLVPLGNGGHGIVSSGRASVAQNHIAFNHRDGVSVHPNSTILSNVIHSNGSLGIDLGDDGVTEGGASDVLAIPVITGAHATGSETRITFRAPPPPNQLHTTYVEFFAASFADASGHGEAREKISDTGGKSLSAGDNEIVVPRNLAGKFISAVATLLYQGIGSEFRNSSEFSKAVQVTADNCPTLAPLILSSVTENGATTIRWSALPGATEYRIWVMAAGDEPRIAYRGTETEVTRSIAAGVEWWIEARFDPCYGTQSEHRFIPIPSR